MTAGGLGLDRVPGTDAEAGLRPKRRAITIAVPPGHLPLEALPLATTATTEVDTDPNGTNNVMPLPTNTITSMKAIIQDGIESITRLTGEGMHPTAQGMVEAGKTSSSSGIHPRQAHPHLDPDQDRHSVAVDRVGVHHHGREGAEGAASHGGARRTSRRTTGRRRSPPLSPTLGTRASWWRRPTR